jgi:uncharacterized protein GlcG (DUF336 family)
MIRTRGLWWCGGVLGVLALVGLLSASQGGSGAAAQALTAEDVTKILDQAVKAAEKKPSLLRRDANGATLTTRMHVAVVDPSGKVLRAQAMESAWPGSLYIAQAKAYTAAAFSSSNNALSTRSVGKLSQPGGPLWHIGNANAARTKDSPGIIEFPGGLPLYKGGVLVGAIGVSGDGVEEDEDVAEAGAKGFEPIEAIRIDRATGNAVPYTQ